MANAAAGTVWNLPNYEGELYTADMINTPFLSMIGGMNGGVLTENFEYATDSQYDQTALSQKSITETDSITAPTAISYVRGQSKNVIQIFHESVNLSYSKLSNKGRLSGINNAGGVNNVISEKDWQISKQLENIARQIEWHMLQGTYAIATTAAEPNQMRGMIEHASTTNTKAAAGADFSKAIFDEILLTMFTNGALFRNMVLFCGGFQKQAISDVYGYAPESRNVGGVNIKQIETDFGNIGIAPAHRMQPAETIGLYEMSEIYPVFMAVEDKGILFYEPLAKVGASEKGQIYGQVGMSAGPAFLHGTITDLSTS